MVVLNTVSCANTLDIEQWQLLDQPKWERAQQQLDPYSIDAWHHCHTFHGPTLQVVWWLRRDWLISNGWVIMSTCSVYSLWGLLSDDHLSTDSHPLSVKSFPQKQNSTHASEVCLYTIKQTPLSSKKAFGSKEEKCRCLRREAVRLPGTVCSCRYGCGMGY